MDFTPDQITAIGAHGHLVVSAGAGSGKTRVLVERYLRLVDEVAAAAAPGDDPFAAVLAVTFTEKAAREMRERVRRSAAERAQRAVPSGGVSAMSDADMQRLAAAQAYAAASEAARIGTIHSFCAELLRAHPAETGLDPGFVILDEVEAGALLAACIETTLREAVSAGAGRALLEEFAPAELAEVLGAMLRTGGELRAALATLPDDPPALLARWSALLALARAEALAALFAAPAWQAAAATILSLAPAAPAADRIGDQVRAIATWLHTLDQAQPAFATLDAVNLTGGAKKAWGGDEAALAAAKAALRTLRDSYRAEAAILAYAPDPATEARAAAVTSALAGLARAADAAYSRRKLALDRLDFDDLERRARELLEAHPAARARWRRELHAVLVDEFQDTNDDQRAIIYGLTGLGERDEPVGKGEGPGTRRAGRRPALVLGPSFLVPTPCELSARSPGLSGPTGADGPSAGTARSVVGRRSSVVATAQGRSGSTPSLFVVGDGKQSIYRFRGADVSVFREVERTIVGSGGSRVTLRASFRSHTALVDLVNRLSLGLFARPGQPAPFEVPFEPLEATRPAPAHPVAAELHIVPDGEGASAGRQREALALTERLVALCGGDGPLVFDRRTDAWRTPSYGDIAILFRASSSFEPFEAALRARGIPFLTTAGRGYYGRKEVQDLINLLRALDDPADELALVGVLRSPLFALDDAVVVALRLAGGPLWTALLRAADGAPSAADPGLEALFAARSGPLGFAATTLRELAALRGRASVVELLRAALERTGYLATISALADGERRRANVEKLLAAARLAGARGLRAFSDYLDALLRAETREGEAPLEAEGAVRLMTIHRSKGLEFPIVALPDLGRGAPNPNGRWLARRPYGLAVAVRRATDATPPPTAFLLARRAEEQMERAEGERLLYVAMTRAQDYLIFSGPAQRKGGERWIARLAAALGHPWEAGGPPAGDHGGLRVYRHDP